MPIIVFVRMDPTFSSIVTLDNSGRGFSGFVKALHGEIITIFSRSASVAVLLRLAGAREISDLFNKLSRLFVI